MLKRKAIHIVLDMVVVSLSVVFAYMLRFDFVVETQYSAYYPYVLSLMVLLAISCFSYFKIYKRAWKYAGIEDYLSILKAVCLSVGLFYLAHHFVINYFFRNIIVPRSVVILSALIMLITITGTRIVVRLTAVGNGKIKPHQRRVLIVGAGEAGTLVVKELKTAGSSMYPVAIVDDDSKKHNLEVLGIPVVGGRERIPTVVSDFAVNDIVIALPSASRNEISELLNVCKNTGCQIKILPSIKDIFNGKVSLTMIRDVSVEDLLGREPIALNQSEICHYLQDKTVLITGAGGSIGSELSRQVSSFSPARLLLLGHGENSIYEIEMELKVKCKSLEIIPIIADIQDKERLQEVFMKYRPQVVFHAAAHKHVPLMERNPVEAVKNNILGTRNVAECAHEHATERFVMISTDKAVNPTNVMGATKRFAELIIQEINEKSNTHFSAVRFGNVLGSRGSVIPVFKKQIEAGGPVTVTHPEMVRYFMTIPEAVQLVIQTGALAKGGEVFILDMGKPVKISDLAHDLIKLSGLEPGKDINVIYTGIRPGEKLFEELLTKEEGINATKHDRIFIGRPIDFPLDTLDFFVRKLEQLVSRPSNKDTEVKIKRVLKQVVSSYSWEETIEEKEASIHEMLQASMEVLASAEKK